MQKTKKKNKHMTLDDRIEIQECLNKEMTFKDIAGRIGKDQTSVSREVKRHLQPHTNSFVKTDEPCPRLLKVPFVCNGCPKRYQSSCKYRRQMYIAKKAQSDYETLLVESRSGIPLNKESFYETERILSDAVRKGQHIYHAIKANNLPVSTATVYRHIQKRYYSIRPIDLPRAVKFKPRKSLRNESIPKSAKQGRTYEDFLAFCAGNTDVPVTELDTVLGERGGKVIMTIHFVPGDFMAGLLLDNKTAAEAANKISRLKHDLALHGFVFGDIIPLLLTDNGGEFSCVSAFENNADGERETNLFFCEPSAAYEKPHIEKNHTMFRDIVPKGQSFDNFTQETVNLIFSHVNAVKRNQFNGRSAYDMFTFFYSEELANAFGISYVPPREVVQSPALLR